MARTKEESLALKEKLRERELDVVAEMRLYHGNKGVAAEHAAIVADRLERWKEVVAAIKVPEALDKWAQRMTAVYGPKVLMHERRRGVAGYETDWITALLIVRYGESEYYWPEVFGKQDMERALTWMKGSKTPAMITYLPKEG